MFINQISVKMTNKGIAINIGGHKMANIATLAMKLATAMTMACIIHWLHKYWM